MNFSPKSFQTHKESIWRFIALIVLLGLYFSYITWQVGFSTGIWVTLLTWSFFVLCTPIADGGFIIAFPVRLLFGARMAWTQIIVWVVAIILNIVTVSIAPEVYAESALTRLLYAILTTPWPYWSILVLSAVGTGLSIWFGDEMMDVASHSKREKYHKHGFNHKMLAMFSLGLLTIFAYYQLIASLGVDIPQ